MIDVKRFFMIFTAFLLSAICIFASENPFVCAEENPEEGEVSVQAPSAVQTPAPEPFADGFDLGNTQGYRRSQADCSLSKKPEEHYPRERKHVSVQLGYDFAIAGSPSRETLLLRFQPLRRADDPGYRIH